MTLIFLSNNIMAGAVNASYPADRTDCVRLSNAARPGFSMKLKAVADKDLSSKYSLNKNVRQLKIFSLKDGERLNLMFQPFKGKNSSK